MGWLEDVGEEEGKAALGERARGDGGVGTGAEAGPVGAHVGVVAAEGVSCCTGVLRSGCCGERTIVRLD